MKDFIITHTSDWHLGKKLYRETRQEEHQYFLDWLTQDIKTSKTDLLVIAGDIFDSPIPTTAALEQYYQFLYRLTQETECEVLIIGGNHDSGRFLEAPKNFLAGHRIHLAGKYHKNKYFQFAKGLVSLFALPFFKVSDFVQFGDQDIRETILEQLQKDFADFAVFSENAQGTRGEMAENSKSPFKLLVAHHMLVNANLTGSENAIGLSGLDYLPLKVLEENFDLVMMGHIHQRQVLGDKKLCYYSGSPLPMRFSERPNKTVLRHSLLQDGSITSIPVPIPQARSLWSLEFESMLSLENHLEKINTTPDRQYPLGHFIELKIDKLNHYPGLGDDLKKLFARYPWAKLISCKFSGTSEIEEQNIDTFELDPQELFLRFYQETYPSEAPSAELLEDFSQLLAQVEDSGLSQDPLEPSAEGLHET